MSHYIFRLFNTESFFVVRMGKIFTSFNCTLAATETLKVAMNRSQTQTSVYFLKCTGIAKRGKSIF